ncbi:bromodomain-containing protein 8-like isoform X2 [Ptychodera flava]|uniref:bromodomain-containing protein 8-like isoform X2 n=1 Tax=Ptychodera flava TaxID=63121 RepID=UPI003969BF7A
MAAVQKTATPVVAGRSASSDKWSIRERLCLASSVMRSGDQNWVSVSRAIKPFGEPTRPPDWFSQKNCASQYSELLETVETPKRKRSSDRGEVETPGDLIVRKLTQERVEELKRQIEDSQQQYRILKSEADKIRRGEADHLLKSIWEDIVNLSISEVKSSTPFANSPSWSWSTVQRAPISQEKKASAEAAEAMRQASEAKAAASAAKPPGKPIAQPLNKSKKKLQNLRLFQAKQSSQQSGSGSGTEDKTESDSGADTPTEIPSSETAASETSQNNKEVTCSNTFTKTSAPPSPLLSSLLKNRHHYLAQEGLTSPNKETTTQLDFNTSTATLSPTTTPTTTTATTVPTSPSPSKQSLAGAPTLSKLLNSPKTISCSSIPKTPTTPVHVGGSDSTPLTVPLPVPSTTEITKDPEPIQIPSIEIQDETSEDSVKIIEQTSPRTDIEVTEPLETESVSAKPSDTDVTVSEEKVDKHCEKDTGDDEKEIDVQSSEKEETLSAETKPVSSLSVDEEVSFKEEPASPSSSTSSARPESDPKSARRRGAKTRTFGSRKSARVRNREKQDEDGEGEMSEKLTRKDGTSDAGSVDERKDDERSEAEEWLAADSGDDGSKSHPHLQFFTESIPGSPASLSQGSDDPEAIQAQKAWKKSIMMVWRAAASHKYANVFLHPVTDDLAPGYHSIVYRPMDLSTIKKNLESGQLRTTSEFQRNIMLMFQNAIMYNSSDHDVYHMAIEMQRDVMEHIQVFLTTQLMVQQSESKESKVLRIRETPTRRQDSSDKDDDQGRRRKLSAEATETSGKKRRTRADE